MADIVVRGLVKEYDTDTGSIVAVKGIDFEIADGEFFTIVGPSGCGKTTTLRCVAGLETPTSGSITFGGQDVTHVPPNKRGIAMMFQSIALYPHMSVRENISYPLRLKNAPGDVQREETEDAAKVMQIEDLLDKSPGQLSGGQQQRAALARTLVQDPHAFLMDEPLSDLDAKLKVEMRKEIQRVHERVNRPTIYVTHDQEEAMTMSDRIAVMDEGEIQQIGTPEELYNAPNSLFVARFIGNPSINSFPAEVRDNGDGQVTVEYDGYTLDVPVVDTGLATGDHVIVGVRPEQLSIGADGDAITRTVQIVERIGDRLLVTTEGDDEIRIVTPPRNDVAAGDNIHISFDPEDAFLFAKSGELIGSGKQPTAVSSA